MRVLIAHNNGVEIDALHAAMTAAGHDVETASRGAEALGIMRSGRCRVMVCARHLPEMDGLELCRAIRAGEGNGRAYIIIMLESGETDFCRAAGAAGADEFLFKPLRTEEIAPRLHAADRALSSDAHEHTMYALACLAEARDPFVGDHLDRIRRCSTALAQELGRSGNVAEIDARFLRLIHATSPLHDIGKVSLPDHILLKPGRLTPQEFELMKMHTTVGGQTLEAVLHSYPDSAYLKMACQIATHHHERFDGSGYPGGIRGSEIPVAARIVALTDVYDALTTKRSYKPAFDHGMAKAILLQSKGSHFDPDVVDAFVRCEKAFIEINEDGAAARAVA